MKKPIKRNKIEQFEPMRESMSLQDAIKESNRCLLCYDAPCNEACPAGTDPAKFIRQIKFYNYKGAARTIRKNNILGTVCSYVCPVEKLCEEKCSIVALEDPINISGLQRFASEYGRDVGIEPLQNGLKNRGKIAIIGAGPAGLSCASELVRKDYDVKILEKEKDISGVLRWNIPEYRLPKEAIEYDIKNVLDLCVDISYNTKVTSANAVLNLLADGYKAVFISAGLSEAFMLPLFEQYSNAVSYIPFLRDIKFNNDSHIIKDKNIAIIGGGSVAIDAAVSAAASGARKVYLISLEHLNELPADEEEIRIAQAMNIIFKAGSQVTEVIAEKDKITGLKGIEIEWVELGVFVPENARQIYGTEFNLNVDLVVQAIGTKPGEELKKITKGIQTTGKGIIKINENFETNISGVFAGGDIVNGGATVVQAVGEGKKAAECIDKHLCQL